MNTNLAYREDPRVELIGGELVAMSPATTRHNLIAGNIYGIFWQYLRDKKCVPFGDGEALFLNDEDEFIPDFMIVCDAEKVKPDGVHGAPDLVVEVLSPGTLKNDRGRKQTVYERSGVREYWIVDPKNKTVEQYILQGERFVLHETYAACPAVSTRKIMEPKPGEIVTEFRCSLYDDLTISTKDIFHRVPDTD